MQSAFVNIGLERDAFLYVSDFLLEEEDDTEGLEQVVSRSRPEIYEVSAQTAHPEPIEAEEIIPPAEPRAQHLRVEDEAEEPGPAETSAETENRDDSDGEGARKWRGRRRRGGRGRFQDRSQERLGDRGPNRYGDRGEQRESRPAQEREPRPVEPVQESQPHQSSTPAHTGQRNYDPII